MGKGRGISERKKKSIATEDGFQENRRNVAPGENQKTKRTCHLNILKKHTGRGTGHTRGPAYGCIKQGKTTSGVELYGGKKDINRRPTWGRNQWGRRTQVCSRKIDRERKQEKEYAGKGG